MTDKPFDGSLAENLENVRSHNWERTGTFTVTCADCGTPDTDTAASHPCPGKPKEEGTP